MQNLERYKVFYHCAKYNNFSAAAKKLFITQSSVSQTIKLLEEELGVPLFFRRGRKVEVTHYGKTLLKHLEESFNQIELAERLLKSEQNLEGGTLKIGASDTLCRHFLLEHFEDFHKECPKVNLDIINKPSPNIVEKLRQNQIDIGFINGKKEDYKAFHAEEVFDAKEIFFTSTEYQHLAESKLSKKEIHAQPFVTLGPQTSTRRFLEKLIGEITPVVEVISIDLSIDLIKAGFGISFTYERLVEKEGLIPLQVDFQIPERQILMLTTKESTTFPLVRHFKELVEKR